MKPTRIYLKDELLILIWDVKHGNAIFIKTPNDKVILIDLGRVKPRNPKNKFSPLDYIKTKYGITTIELLVITHPHFDHFEDILELKRFKLNRFVTPTHIPKRVVLSNIKRHTKPIFDYYLILRKSAKVPLRSIHFDSVKFSFFIHRQSGLSNLNNHSIVTVLEYNGFKVVIPGDNEEVSLKALMKQRRFYNAVKKSNYLVAPHHGRKAGFYEPFVELVDPELTIISDGEKTSTAARNRYTRLSSGRIVLSKNRRPFIKPRKTLVTKVDGAISIRIGNDSKGKPKDRVKLS